MNKGIYAGSFDPITVGHLDIIKRASKLCDELTILVVRNYSKQMLFTEEERVEMIRQATSGLSNVKIEMLPEGHLATYVLENGYNIVYRGLRNSKDFAYEIDLAQIYAKFYNYKVETVYLMTDPRYSYISSSVVKENFLLNADVSGWVDDSTLKLMKSYRNTRGF